MPDGSKAAFLHRLLDSGLILSSLFVVGYAYDPFSISMGPYYWAAGLGAVLGFLIVAEVTHLYSSWRVYRFRQELAELAVTIAVVGGAMVTIAFLTKTSEHYSRVIITLWCVLSFCALVFQRAMLRRLLHRTRAQGRNMKSFAIVGAGDFACRVAERLLRANWLGLRLAGFYDDGAAVGTRPLAGRPFTVNGDFDAVIQLARSGGVDYVYIALPPARQEQIVRLIRELSDSTASVFLVPDLFTFEIAQARWTEIDSMPVVAVFDTPFLGVDGWLKRIEDVSLALLLLVPALPLGVLIGLGVKLTSRGPILFRQRRYGLSGKVVEVLKFRSMTALEDGERIHQAQRCDPRVTRFGAFLRRTSLDELPQLINVLRGDMSIVGPRPHAVAHNEQYRKLVPGYMLRHKVKPGITGWAQVNGWRGETDTLEKMRKRIDCDLYYIRNWSVWLDLKILALTMIRGFVQRNAY
jgi:putative colanic acid biosynthesis UDP-glucose lipid carrier transferase